MSKSEKRRIIVCLDGTWDSPTEQTNIEIFYQAIETSKESNDGFTQYPAYFSGVGTTSFHILGGMFGVGISRQIKDAYTFICNNYLNDEDEIWCIGFSRGAYAVRSLCGMIYNVGLLSPHPTHLQIEEAYQLYRSRSEDTKPGKKLSEKFRDHHKTRQPLIKFLGCFDTVGALGVPKLPWYLGGTLFYNLFQGMSGFHDTKVVPNLCNAFHALSIHDQRDWFQPTMMDYATSENKVDDQRVQQVWFPGMHSDVGGGEGKSTISGDKNKNDFTNNDSGKNDNVKSGDEGGGGPVGEVGGATIGSDFLLPNNSLFWMMSKAQKLGLLFKPGDNGLLLPSKKGQFVYNDSYLNLFIYQLVDRKDRVIPSADDKGVYKETQIYNNNNLLAYMEQRELDLYLSKTLIQFNKHFDK